MRFLDTISWVWVREFRIMLGLVCTLLILGVIYGCQGVSPAEGLLLSCKAFAKELAILAPLRADGTLSKTAIEIVDGQKKSVDPICDGEAPDVNADVKHIAVDAGTKVLISVATQFLAK